MKKYITSIGVAAFMILASYSANSAITTASSQLFVNTSGYLEYRCKVTQTTGAADFAAYPSGKATPCLLDGEYMPSVWCSTNAPQGDTCPGGDGSWGFAYEGSHVLTTTGMGGVSGGWEFCDQVNRRVVCNSFGFCLPG